MFALFMVLVFVPAARVPGLLMYDFIFGVVILSGFLLETTAPASVLRHR
jgi:hypothetical protein